mgnify:CR=1 FL=1
MESEDLVCGFHDRICFWCIVMAENHFLTSRSISFASAYSFCSMAVINHWWFPSCHQWSKGCSLSEQGVVSPYQHSVQYRPHGSPFPCRNPKTCFIPSLSKPNAVIYASPPRWVVLMKRVKMMTRSFPMTREKFFAVMGCGRKWMKEAWFFAEQKFRSQTQVSEAAEANECDCEKCSTPMIAP